MIRSSLRRRDPSPKVAASVRPLIVTADEDLLDDLLRLAAAAGVDVDVAPDPPTARSRWPAAPLVVVGDDQAAGLAALAPTRRHGVYVVTRALAGPGGIGTGSGEVWRHGMALGAEHVLVFPDDDSWLADRLADAAEGDSGDALVLGVVGGRGGAGASALAAAVSVVSARRGLTTALVDVDPLGGGIDLALGAEAVAGVRWPELAGSRGRLSARDLLGELPARHGVSIVSCDRRALPSIPAAAFASVLSATRRACDLVVLDLPRHVESPVDDALAACSTVLLVVPIEVRAVAASVKVAGTVTAIAGDVRVVARGPATSGLDATEVSTALSLPLAVDMSADPSLQAALDRGEPPGRDLKGPLAAACTEVLDSLLVDLRRVA